MYVQRRDLLKIKMDEARCYHRHMMKWAPVVIYSSTRHKRGQWGDRRLPLQWSYQSQNIPELNTRAEVRKTDIRDITTDSSAFSHSSALRGAENQAWHEVDIMSLREGDKLFSRNGQHRKLERSSGNFFLERKAYCFVVSISLFPILPEKRKS